ncbi:MAG TPA: hypothetical protein ENJ09_01935 [Planctomycetes bacterium]|nr:hypothetical protein [Planctomycetota bacterium]
MSSSLFAAGLGLAALLSVPAPPRVSLANDDDPLSLREHAALRESMAELAAAHPDLARLELVGTSRAGRAIEALRITAVDEPRDVPGILLVANLEGTRVFASAVALDHARRLLEGYADSESVRMLLDANVVWVVPRANPDAAEARFLEPRAEHLASGVGVDDDRDGRQGEDPPADLNGDGLVTMMRVPDPDGEWIPDPNDPRALVKADPAKGEHGTFALYPESRDRDGDERFGEDQPHDGRVDRNFPAGWQEGEAAAGLFATDDPEARALCEFVLARPNLSLVVIYDGPGNLVEDPKSVADDAKAKQRIPPAGWLESDAGYLKEIARRYRRAVGNETEGEDDDAGTFGRWCYEHRGLFVLCADLWELPFGEASKDEADGADEKAEGEDPQEEQAEPERKPSEDAKRLLWVDAHEGEAWRFVPWTPFDHPELGEVEIGGFAPFARVEPPAEEGAKIARDHFAWFTTLGSLPARAKIVECTRERVGDGLFEVRAVIENSGFLPLLSRSGRRTRTTRPARLKLLLPEAGGLVAGKRQVLIEDLSGSGGRFEYTALVRGPEGMEIAVTLDSDHAGSDMRTAEENQ